MKKQIEPKALDPLLPLLEPGQSGSGIIENSESTSELNYSLKNKMDPKIFESFQKPRFVKTDKIVTDLKRKSTASNVSAADKRLKTSNFTGKSGVKHKFQFY